MRLISILLIFCAVVMLFFNNNAISQIETKIPPVYKGSDKSDFNANTIKRNEFIVYNVKKDTVIGAFEISVTNMNIYEKYVHQYLYLNDSLHVVNFYPEMRAIVEIQKNNVSIFKKEYVKADFPKGNFDEFIDKATVKDFKFEAFDERSKEFVFISTIAVPNTDFVNDFHLIISEKGKSKLEWIDYESED